ncbi:MAG: restriction endonuclease subunit S [Methylobacter sp.]|nr:restriction endonuclease subunit S [Methylobacter sp.]
MSGKYQAYADYKPTHLGWLNQIPSHWEVKRLKYLGEALIGLTYSPDEVVEEDEGILVLRSSNVQNKQLAFDDNVYVNKKIPQKLVAQKGDILICARNGSRALIGKNAQIDECAVGMTFGAFMSIFRSPYNNYLSKVFNSALFEYQSGSFLTATINQLTTGNLNSFEVPLPPEAERKKIANFLDHETSKIDILIEKQQQLIKLLKEKRQAVISHAVTKGLNPNVPMRDSDVEWLGEVPEHWCGLPLKLLVRTRKGVAFKSDDFCDNGIHVVKASDIKQLSIRTSDVFLPEKFVETYPKAILASGDIILSTVGSNPDVINSAVGQIGMVPQELAGTLLNQNTVVYDPDEKNVIREYLFFVLQMREYRDYLDLHAHGTANQSSLSIEDMLSFQVSLPPINEQVEICNYLNIQQEKLTTLEQRAHESELLLKERRTALISAAVTGKIDVRNWQFPEPFHNDKEPNKEEAA